MLKKMPIQVPQLGGFKQRNAKSMDTFIKTTMVTRHIYLFMCHVYQHWQSWPPKCFCPLNSI